MMALHTITGKQQFWELPTARNSKRLPQKGKGAVRFRSSTLASMCMAALHPVDCFFFSASPPATRLSMNCSKPCPGYSEMMAGGASCAPKRWSFPAEATVQRTISLYWARP
eukprot:Skav211055  [mRNA]  locus=scaffold5518:1505:2646:- [translate_table: standard]